MRRGAGAVRNDGLHALFAELRRLKQEELPRHFTDPVQQAYHDERIRGAIRRVEEEIERRMVDGCFSDSHNNP